MEKAHFEQTASHGGNAQAEVRHQEAARAEGQYGILDLTKR